MIQPIKELLVVEVDQEADKSEGGIIIPEAAKEKQQKGTVIAVGGDVKEVRAGHRILFGKYSGSEVEVNGRTFLVFKEDDVLGIIIDKRSK